MGACGLVCVSIGGGARVGWGIKGIFLRGSEDRDQIAKKIKNGLSTF